ncbi:MAG: hypothetical protein M3Q70_02230 [bacterium]|nr:hypothetical protein [bacterium]
MSNYSNQDCAFERLGVDGTMVLSERLKGEAFAQLKDPRTTPDYDLLDTLRALANRHPNPNLQANYFLKEFDRVGICTLDPFYDSRISAAWQAEHAGFPNLAGLALSEVGLSLTAGSED